MQRRHFLFITALAAAVPMAAIAGTWTPPSGSPPTLNAEGPVWLQTGAPVVQTGKIRISDDIYRSSGKAIRVDNATSSVLNIGNWGAGATGFSLGVYGDINVNGSAGLGTLSVYQICFTADTCRTTWPTGGGGAFVDEIGDTMTGTLNINVNSVPSTPLQTNNTLGSAAKFSGGASGIHVTSTALGSRAGSFVGSLSGTGQGIYAKGAIGVFGDGGTGVYAKGSAVGLLVDQTVASPSYVGVDVRSFGEVGVLSRMLGGFGVAFKGTSADVGGMFNGSNYGVVASGSIAGAYFEDSAGASGYGVKAEGGIAGVEGKSNNVGGVGISGVATAGAGSYGVSGDGSTGGGTFQGTVAGLYAFGNTYGIYAQGNAPGGIGVEANGGLYGVDAVCQDAGCRGGRFTGKAYGVYSTLSPAGAGTAVYGAGGAVGGTFGGTTNGITATASAAAGVAGSFVGGSSGSAVQAQGGAGATAYAIEALGPRSYFQQDVGIGVASPAVRLDVVDNVAGPVVKVTNGSLSGWSAIDFYQSGGVSGAYVGWGNNSVGNFPNMAYFGTAGAYPTSLVTNGVRRMNIDNNGNVQIGAMTPSAAKVTIAGTVDPALVINNTAGNPAIVLQENGAFKGSVWVNAGNDDFNFGVPAMNPAMTIKGATARVGINTTAPTMPLSVNGNADKVGGGSWAVFSDIRLKNELGSFDRGLDELEKISPKFFRYKEGNPLGYDSDLSFVGFSAQEVKKVIPEAVTANENGYLQLNQDPILWTMLNSIKELKAENDELRARVEALEKK